MTLKHAKQVLADIGITIRRSYGDEYRVNFKGGSEGTAYYTSSIDDAIATGERMVVDANREEEDTPRRGLNGGLHGQTNRGGGYNPTRDTTGIDTPEYRNAVASCVRRREWEGV